MAASQSRDTPCTHGSTQIQLLFLETQLSRSHDWQPEEWHLLSMGSLAITSDECIHSNLEVTWVHHDVEQYQLRECQFWAASRGYSWFGPVASASPPRKWQPYWPGSDGQSRGHQRKHVQHPSAPPAHGFAIHGQDRKSVV